MNRARATVELRQGKIRKIERVPAVVDGFECVLDPTQWATLRFRLLAEFDVTEDSLRFYFLGSQWRGRVEHHGTKPSHDPEGPLIA